MTPWVNNLLEQLTELREALNFSLQVYYVIKDMMKDSDVQPYEESHKARARRVLREGTSVPVDLGVLPSFLAHECVH